MKKGEYIIITDLDGTLLTDDGIIDNENIECLRERVSKLYFASGRHFDELSTILKTITHEDSLFICCDGQYIYNASGEVLFENDFLSTQDLLRISKISKSCKMEIITNTHNYCFQKGIISLVKKVFVRDNNIVLNFKYIEGKIEKVRIEKTYINSANLLDLSNQYSVHLINNKYYDIQCKGVNKYNAILKLREYINCHQPIVYFGDDDNDIECFENITYSIAPSNASNAVKERAFFVGLSNNESFISSSIKKLEGNM